MRMRRRHPTRARCWRRIPHRPLLRHASQHRIVSLLAEQLGVELAKFASVLPLPRGEFVAGLDALCFELAFEVDDAHFRVAQGVFDACELVAKVCRAVSGFGELLFEKGLLLEQGVVACFEHVHRLQAELRPFGVDVRLGKRRLERLVVRHQLGDARGCLGKVLAELCDLCVALVDPLLARSRTLTLGLEDGVHFEK